MVPHGDAGGTMLELIEKPDGPSFFFWAPIEKGGIKEEAGRRLIQGVASTPDRDSHNETVVMSGLDTTYLYRFGKFNWEHRKGPEDIIGEPTEGEITPARFFVKGFLYSGLPRADAAWALLQATKELEKPAVGFSVEGKVLERDKKDLRRVIRALVVNIAITANPVNPNTYADVVKSFAGLDAFKSFDTTAGSPLMAQDLEGSDPVDLYLRAHLGGVRCRCCDEVGNFHHGYPGALHHFTDCLGAPLMAADHLAQNHRQIAERFALTKRS